MNQIPSLVISQLHKTFVWLRMAANNVIVLLGRICKVSYLTKPGSIPALGVIPSPLMSNKLRIVAIASHNWHLRDVCRGIFWIKHYHEALGSHGKSRCILAFVRSRNVLKAGVPLDLLPILRDNETGWKKTGHGRPPHSWIYRWESGSRDISADSWSITWWPTVCLQSPEIL